MKRPLLSRFVAFEAMATAARRTAKLARKRRTGNRADVAAGGTDDRDQHAVVFSRLPRAGATYQASLCSSTDHGRTKWRGASVERLSLSKSQFSCGQSLRGAGCWNLERTKRDGCSCRRCS